MAGKALKRLIVTILDQQHLRGDWQFDFDGEQFRQFIAGMTREMRKLGFDLTCVRNHDVIISINSYADLLNCVKVSSDDSQGTHCIGHIIGKSEHLDIMEDVGSGNQADRLCTRDHRTGRRVQEGLPQLRLRVLTVSTNDHMDEQQVDKADIDAPPC